MKGRDNAIEELKKNLRVKKERTLRDDVEALLIDKASYLAYKFFKSKYGKKIVDKLHQRVMKELKENNVPEAYHKREIDRIINYRITIQTIFQKSLPLFLKWITKIEKKKEVFLRMQKNRRK